MCYMDFKESNNLSVSYSPFRTSQRLWDSHKVLHKFSICCSPSEFWALRVLPEQGNCNVCSLAPDESKTQCLCINSKMLVT